jgi:hypothetical protein
MHGPTPVQAKDYPRLIRYVTSTEMPNSRTLATLDRSLNLLRINIDLWDNLTLPQKREVWRTQSDEIVTI